MNIPNDIKICGLDHKVIEDSNLTFNGMVAYGTIDYQEQVVTLNPTIAKHHDNKCMTFLHEVIHGIIHHYDLSIQDNEKVIDGLSKGLYQVIKDNPKMFI